MIRVCTPHVGRGTPNCFAVDCFTEQTWIISSISKCVFRILEDTFRATDVKTDIYNTNGTNVCIWTACTNTNTIIRGFACELLNLGKQLIGK